MNRSAKFVSLFYFAMRQIRAATTSLHLRYAMLRCFLRNTDSFVDVFLNIDPLSQNISVGPLSGTPNMRSLYHNVITNSTVSLRAVNSDPKVNVSTEFCFSLSYITGDQLQNINIPVCDYLVTLYDA